MDILTRDYGTVDVDVSSIIRFENGIIGFEDFHEYVLLDCSTDEPSPFRCLQSTEESSLAFMLFDPYAVRPDYEVEIDDDAIDWLSIDNSDDIVIMAIVVVPDEIKMMTINLKAPIIINARVNKGIQYIVDNSEYSVRHLITEEVERARNIRLCKDQRAV